MPVMNTDQTQPENAPTGSRPFRGLLARFRTRRARRSTPDPSIVEIMAQWAEYEMIFNDILQRLSAQLARQAKMEKKRLERIAEQLELPDIRQAPEAPPNSKDALRSQYARARYGGRVESLLAAKEGNGVPNNPVS